MTNTDTPTEVPMAKRTRVPNRVGRALMRSPERLGVGKREDCRRFWLAIAARRARKRGEIELWPKPWDRRCIGRPASYHRA